MNTPYFSLVHRAEEHAADVYIFGDIAQRRGGISGLLQSESDQSSYGLINQLAGIPEDYAITVHINTNGGELKEGLGIYNVLKDRNVTTICEGFAASAGSVIFCAGKTRIMKPASLLFIHQAHMLTEGNSDELKKAAEDLRIITQSATEAYKEAGVNLDAEQLDAMLKAETWLTPEEAVKYGFATSIGEPDDEEDAVRNDAMRSIMAAVKRPAPQEPEILNTLSRISDEYGELLNALKSALNTISSHPELLVKMNMLLNTNEPEVKKGFFGF